MRFSQSRNRITENTEAIEKFSLPQLPDMNWEKFLGIYKDIITLNPEIQTQVAIKSSIKRYREDFPETTIRQKHEWIVTARLKRAGLIFPKEASEKLMKDTQWAVYRIMNESEIREALKNKWTHTRLRKSFLEFWMKEGYELFIAEENENRSLKWEILRFPATLIYVMKILQVSTKPILATKRVLIEFGIPYQKVFSLPLRSKRIADKRTILENSHLKSFFEQELRGINTHLDDDFSRALTDTIRKWNRVHAKNTWVYLPVSLNKSGKWKRSLSQILGTSWRWYKELIAALWLPEDTWKEKRWKWKRKK